MAFKMKYSGGKRSSFPFKEEESDTHSHTQQEILGALSGSNTGPIEMDGTGMNEAGNNIELEMAGMNKGQMSDDGNLTEKEISARRQKHKEDFDKMRKDNLHAPNQSWFERVFG